MAVEPGQAAQVEELFAGLGAIRTRRMFGALGVYCGELFFAVADDGMIYLKADDASEGEFRAAGSEPFAFTDKEGVVQTMRYWRLPEEAFDDPDEALRWGRLAVEAALRAKGAQAEEGARQAVSARDVVVTGGDAGYFPLVDELCASVRAFRDSQALGLVCIDGGMTGEQKAHLSERWGARVLEVGWGFDIPARRIRGREHLKVLTARTFLDRHLPEADVIVWLDGDTWVQDATALDLLIAGARLGRLAVVSQTSRYAQTAMSLRWAPLGYAQVRSILYKGARRARLPEAIARQIGDKPTFNAGVFALARDAPHWEAWRARQAQCLVHGRVFTSDQLALGVIVHADGLPAELMPETCNYMGPNWMASADGSRLVERYLPNAPVGIVHMAGYDAMRVDAGLTLPIPTLGGGEVRRSLRRFAWAA